MTSVEDKKKEEQVKIPADLPVLPLRDMVVYPFIIAPLSVARDISIQAERLSFGREFFHHVANAPGTTLER